MTGPVFNPLVTSRFADGVRKILGEDVSLDSIAPELLLAYVLENDRPENLLPMQTTLGGGIFTVTSGAGVLCEALLYNPPGSLTLVTLKRVRFSITVAFSVFYRLLRAAAPPAGFVDGNTGPLDTRDPRLISARGTTARVMQAANATADGGIAFDGVTPPVGVLVEDDQAVVLAPGTGLVLSQSAVGVNTMTGGFRWLEREMKPEESVP